jgi:hypothetical protein
LLEKVTEAVILDPETDEKYRQRLPGYVGKVRTEFLLKTGTKATILGRVFFDPLAN